MAASEKDSLRDRFEKELETLAADAASSESSVSPERIELTTLSGTRGTISTRINGEMRDSSLISRGKM